MFKRSLIALPPAWAALAAAAPALAAGGESRANTLMWYRQPARTWSESLPVGNGRLGAMVWGMYPGNEISVAGTPELAKAVAKSLEFRGVGSTGFGSTWQMCLWARMFDGQTAFDRLVVEVMKFTHRNLWGDCYGSPQMDSAQGASAGIAEMLLQSQEGDIHLLPALPKAWPDGHVKGMRARGGFEVDFAWKAGKLTGAAIRSKSGRPCRVRCGDKTVDLSLKPGESCELDSRLARK
jgi:alpha-L-fucosidase 2